jgi:hypothetical protein
MLHRFYTEDFFGTEFAAGDILNGRDDIYLGERIPFGDGFTRVFKPQGHGGIEDWLEEFVDGHGFFF